MQGRRISEAVGPFYQQLGFLFFNNNAFYCYCFGVVVDQLAVIEEFKLNREELEECIQSLEEEIAHREEVNQAQLEQQDREQVEGKNKYDATFFRWQMQNANVVIRLSTTFAFIDRSDARIVFNFSCSIVANFFL